MVNANKLRIGNWVIVNHHWIKVDFIYGDLGIGLKRTPDDNLVPEWPNYFIYPIPLTPEILESCGLEGENEVNGIHVFYSVKESFILSLKNENGTFSKEVKYLHQLQNGYYWHTDKELEVKPAVTA